MNENTYTDVVRHTPIGHSEPNNVSCKINGVPTCVPMDDDNKHWAEIQSLVEAGELTIADADPLPEAE